MNISTAQKLPTSVNGVAVDRLFSAIDAVKATPSIAKFKFRIRNQWETGAEIAPAYLHSLAPIRNCLIPSHFSLEADEPAILLGMDMAADPVEYLLHAVASCLTTSMVYHASARGIHIEQIESSFEGDLDLRGFLSLNPSVRKGYQGIRALFKISANVPDGRLREIVQLGTGHSPVFDSLTNGVPVSITAERL